MYNNKELINMVKEGLTHIDELQKQNSKMRMEIVTYETEWVSPKAVDQLRYCLKKSQQRVEFLSRDCGGEHKILKSNERLYLETIGELKNQIDDLKVSKLNVKEIKLRDYQLDDINKYRTEQVNKLYAELVDTKESLKKKQDVIDKLNKGNQLLLDKLSKIDNDLKQSIDTLA